MAFAVLGLAIAGGIGALYTHRQNQETVKKQQIADLMREIEQLKEENTALVEDFNARTLAPTLQLAVKEKALPLIRIAPDKLRFAVPPSAEPATEPEPKSPTLEKS